MESEITFHLSLPPLLRPPPLNSWQTMKHILVICLACLRPRWSQGLFLVFIKTYKGFWAAKKSPKECDLKPQTPAPPLPPGAEKVTLSSDFFLLFPKDMWKPKKINNNNILLFIHHMEKFCHILAEIVHHSR